MAASSGMPPDTSSPAVVGAQGAAVRSAGGGRGRWLPSGAAASLSARARLIPDSEGTVAPFAASTAAPAAADVRRKVF